MIKRRPQAMKQLALPFPVKPCLHRCCFVSHAYCPAGLVCADCGELLFQYLPQSPDQLGYVSADWAWKHVHGKEWTTRI